MWAFQALEGNLGGSDSCLLHPYLIREPLQEDSGTESQPLHAGAVSPEEEAGASGRGPGPAGPKGGEPHCSPETFGDPRPKNAGEQGNGKSWSQLISSKA